MCHQTVSLVARYLEEHGLSTVILGSARDIVEYCGVPRFLFVDFPLGNPCGQPWDREMQADIANTAVNLLATVQQPRTTEVAHHQWTQDPDWRRRYNYVGPENAAQLRSIGDARRQRQAAAKSA